MPTAYCQKADLELRLSALGVSLRLDDDVTAVDDVIGDASEWINFYCEGRYEQAQLALSLWIKYRCRDIAILFLCIRRLNAIPKSAQFAYDQAIKALEKVQAATMVIPGIEPRKTPGPVLSQPRPVLWPIPHTVIERGRSTGQPEGYSRRDDQYEPPYPPN